MNELQRSQLKANITNPNGLAQLGNQVKKPLAPPRNLPAVRNGAQLNGTQMYHNGKPNDSDQRRPRSAFEAADAFEFNY